MRPLLIIVCVLFNLNVFAQDSKEYEYALSVIKSDTTILDFFCSDTSEMNIAVYNKHEFFSLLYFKDQLAKSREISITEAETLLSNADKKVKKKKNKLGYIQMSPDVINKFESVENPCAIVCFDRIRDGFLIAEITYYSEGDWWDEIRNNQSSFFLLFDLNGDKNKYYKVKIDR